MQQVYGRRLRGFSLIELLVVITIVGVMVSMMLPALSQARAVAQIAKCLSGARQASVAVIAYATDNRQYIVSGRTHYANSLPGSPSFAYFGLLVAADYAQEPLFTNKGGCAWGPRTYWGRDLWYAYGNGHDYYSDPDLNYGTTYGLNGTLQSGYGMTSPYVPPYWQRHGTMRFEDYRLSANAVYTPLILDSHIPWRADTSSTGVAIQQMLGVLSYGVQSKNPRHGGTGLNSVSADGSGHWVRREVAINSALWSKEAYFWGFRGVNTIAGLDSGQPKRDW